MIDIIVPKMVPPGERVQIGQRTSMPTCERCMRSATERNPISLMERPAWGPKGPRLRKDALCFECRMILKGER